MPEATFVIAEEKIVRGEGCDRWAVVLTADGIPLTGRAAEGALRPGSSYRFDGQWNEHPKYGRQFKFTRFVPVTPVSELGVTSYLSRGYGIGPRRAEAIWQRYGEHSLEKLRTNPDAVAAEIPGLTVENARRAAEMFGRMIQHEAVTIELDGILKGFGFPNSLTQWLIQRYGTTAAAVVKENPYIVMLAGGVGFTRADRFFLAMGGKANDLKRQTLCVWNALRKDGDGSTWFPLSWAQGVLQKAIAGAGVDLDGAINNDYGSGLLAVEKQPENGESLIALGNHAEHERSLAECVFRRTRWWSPGEDVCNPWPVVAGLEGLDAQQVTELSKAFNAGTLGILAGRPGCGKTFVLSRVLRKLLETVPRYRIAVCAPTARAAVRISELIPGIDARTIHSLLGIRRDGQAAHGPANKLPVDYLFMDEASMVEMPLLTRLLMALEDYCKVLLIGDPDQLSPVGNGAPLRDLIAAGVPAGHLTEIHRNRGRIVKCCKDIAEKKVFVPSPGGLELLGDEPENLLHIECGTPEEQIEDLKKIVGRIANGGAYNPVWDVQVLCAVNRNSDLARDKLNALLQDMLNPDGQRLEGHPWRVGDKAINLKNSWYTSKESGEVLVANGEMAEVLEIHERHSVVKVWPRGEVVTVPVGVKGANKKQDSDDDDEETVRWDLGYACTVHKAQGAQFPVVIMLADGSAAARRVVDRHHVYTALSRPEDICITIGKRAVIAQACFRSNMWQRRTLLRERIEELRLDAAWDEELESCVRESNATER